MNKRLIWVVVLTFTLILAIAAPALAVAFSGIVTLQVSTNTTYSYYPAYINMDNSFLAAHYYTLPSLLDVKVEDTGNTSLAMMPTENRTWFIPTSLAANSITSFRWSSSNTLKSAHQIIVGNGGYVTTADAAKLEPHDNFTLTASVFLPSTGTYTAFDKLNALRLDYNASTQVLTLKAGTYASPDETLTATGVAPGLHTIVIDVAYTSAPSSSLVIYPASAGDYENIVNEYPNGKPHYQIMKGSVAYPYADYVQMAAASAADLYTFDSTAGVSSLDAVKLSIWTGCNYYSSIRFKIKMAGYSVWSSDAISTYGLDWTIPALHELELLTNPVTSAPWQVSDLTGIQFGFSASEYAGMNTALEMHVTLSAGLTVPELRLFVDNTETPADTEDLTAPIPDNSNNWVWYPNPYFNLVTIRTAN